MIRGLLAFALVILATCLASFALPCAADAQQAPSRRRIGVLFANLIPEKGAQAFLQGLQDAGYSEGRDVVIEWHSANGDSDRLSELAARLARRKVDVIVAGATQAAQAAKRGTSTIPIVMALVADPVGSGLVANLAHPGGNVTGLSLMSNKLDGKRLQLLKEAIPRIARVAVLWNPDTPFQPKVIEGLKAAAPSYTTTRSGRSNHMDRTYGEPR